MSGKAPTIKDVAKEAGVSIAQVSRVLNNGEMVKPETFLKIRKVIERLGYVPDARGGGRASNVTGGDSVMVLHMHKRSKSSFSPVHLRLMEGIESELARHRLKLTYNNIAQTSPILKDNELEGVKGIILMGEAREIQTNQSLFNRPCVRTMGSGWGDQGFDRITYDNSEVGILAAEYLMSLGCRNYAAMGYEYTSEIFDSRLHTFSWRLKKEGINCQYFNKVDNATGWDFPIHEFKEAKIDGLFCVADIIALFLYPELKAAGINPGSDVNVVSCNMDHSYLSGLNPLPAVIDLHSERVGAASVRQLLWRIENPHEQRRKILTPVEFLTPEEVKARLNNPEYTEIP